MHGPTAWGQWVVELLQYTASLLGSSGHGNSYNALPHCVGAVGNATPAMYCLAMWGQWAGQFLHCTTALPRRNVPWGSCNALPHFQGALSCATPAIRCLTALAVGSGTCSLHCLTPRGVRCNSCNALLLCLGAVGNGTRAMHCLTACCAIPDIHRLTGLGQWAVELLQYTSSLLGGSGQCNSCNALRHCLVALGSGAHRCTASLA